MENQEIFNKIAIAEIKTQSDFLSDRIKNMIITKELEEGYRFPNENDFCRMLNVGRGTLREAYKILDTEGYIKRTKHGTYVKKREDVAKQGNFKASLELADMDELVEFICALEPEAAFLAAKRMTDEQLEQVRTLIEECENCKDDSKALAAKNYELHEYIRTASGNQLMISALTAYYDIFNQQVIQRVYVEDEEGRQFIEEAIRNHRLLLEAFENHDPEAARKIAYEHLYADVEYRLSRS